MTDHIPDLTKMAPGPDLDRLVAEKVMGWIPFSELSRIGAQSYCVGAGSRRVSPGRSSDFNPSTNIAHAWEVVEKVTAITGPRVGGIPCGSRFMFEWNKLDLWASNAHEAAHSICLAALRAVGAVC